MKFDQILVYLNDEPDSMHRLARAATLASAHHARLLALFGTEPTSASSLPTSGEPGYLDPEEIRQLDRQLAERTRSIAAPLQSRFEELLTQQSLSGEWHSETGTVENLTRRAMYCDLTLLGRHGDTATSVRPEEVALQSGRPVAVLPTAGNHAWPPRRILCAWNGRREAVRAIIDAMPLLRTAEEVHVMTVTRAALEGAPRAGAEIVHYLEQRGIPARLQNAYGSNADVFRIIVEQAYAIEADLLVMGAYGHSRLRESLIGGATREALEGVPLPLFMSH